MRLFTTLFTMVCAATLSAQDGKAEFKAFNHLDVGVTLGSTGVGLDVAAPIGDYVQLRTGFDVMPRIEKRLSFDVQSYGYNDEGNLMNTKFDKMAEKIENFIGYKPSPQVDMIGKPTFWNFKLLFDVFPFHDKRWHVTAGFYWGPSKIAEAVNALEHAPTLVAVNIYNGIYEKVYNGDPIFGDFSLGASQSESILQNGRMGIHLGEYTGRYVTKTVTEWDDNGEPVTHEEYVLDKNGNKIAEPYNMEPDKDCTVSARVKVNSFKPYIGFGYSGRLLKKDDRYKVGFDVGLLYWGGTPAIITHDGTNLSKDVKNIGGKVGDYVSLISAFKVYPVLSVRISRRLF